MPREGRGGGAEDGRGKGEGRGQNIGPHDGRALGGHQYMRRGKQNETGSKAGTSECVKYESKE